MTDAQADGHILDYRLGTTRDYGTTPVWRRNDRGNLYRRMGGVLVTIFPHRLGYAFCVADANGPRFSDDDYPTVAEAIEAVTLVLAE